MGTTVWFIGTQITFKIGDVTGHCLDANLTRLAGVSSRRSCRLLAGETTWSAFDISGHTFLLIWCLYMTATEFKLFNTFRYKTHPFFIELLAFLLAGWIAILSLVWLVMLGKSTSSVRKSNHCFQFRRSYFSIVLLKSFLPSALLTYFWWCSAC